MSLETNIRTEDDNMNCGFSILRIHGAHHYSYNVGTKDKNDECNHDDEKISFSLLAPGDVKLVTEILIVQHQQSTDIYQIAISP